MGRIIIIDDDVEFSKVLKRKLQHHFPEEIAVFNTIDEEFLQTNFLDLVFLDIEMGSVNGMDVARILKRRKDAPLVIFVSNQEGLIHDTLELQPFYFIRKQYLETDLNIAMSLLKGIHFRIRESVAIGEDVYDVKDIIYLESTNHTISVVSKSGRKEYRNTLDVLAKQLSPYLCIRVHRSFIINMRYIERFYSHYITLITGEHIEVGRKFQAEAKKAYQEAKLDGYI